MIWLHFQDCTETLLRPSHPDLGDLILNIISLEYHETLMAGSSRQAEETLAQAYSGKYVCVVEGTLTVELFRSKYECGSNVEILDLGTSGLDLAPYLYGTDLVVIADAAHAEEKPGTLRIYCEADLLAHGARFG